MTDPQPQDPYGGQPYSGSYPQGYPGQYPSAYPPPQYPYPQYPPQAYGAPYPPAYPPPYPQLLGPRRPGTATAAAVLAFVTAGLLVLAGLLVMAGASLVHDISTEFDNSPHPSTGELTLDGVLDLVAAGLLLAAGVLINAGKPLGRTLLCTAGGIVLACSVYWLIRFGGVAPQVIFYALMFAALVIIAMSMAFTASARAWLSGAKTSQPTAQPPAQPPAPPYR